MLEDAAVWGLPDRQRLRAARGLHGHSQAACASRLRELGSGKADQTAVSRWERGHTGLPRPAALVAIRRYIDEVVERLPAEAPRAIGSEQPHEMFDSAVRDVTKEPLLGPRQADFVDAMIERLRSGPEMSDGDDRVRVDLMRILGLR
jgi:transcriptional regulator with XRE-family HTH domain